MTTKTKKCSSCNKRKLLANFYKNANSKDGFAGQCKKCRDIVDRRNKKARKDSGDPQYHAVKILLGMKRRQKKMGFKKAPGFTVEEVKDVILNNTCAVTNRHFNPKNVTKYKCNPFMASPDRVDSSKGYTKKNVRWVMWWVNSARGVYDIEFFAELLKGVKF